MSLERLCSRLLDGLNINNFKISGFINIRVNTDMLKEINNTNDPLNYKSHEVVYVWKIILNINYINSKLKI